ncbi:hypothetical protein XELAEV_18013505mg [Xenopus laevis]|uniref:Methyltransferase type 11 domain-containing protein n=1 Tax=Xenopus laevis TaxID=8355 RepID=A0A974DQR1_XENLA|nr:hypothetical protein XELAEV_18013505mg [Xenopus laevis]
MALHILLLQICVGLVALPVHLLAFLGLWDRIAKKVLPYLLERIAKEYNRKMGDEKRKLFSNMSDFAGASGKLAILDLGCGTGANFQYYPPGSKVTCVDPNPNFQSFLARSLAESQHVHFQRFVVAPGENMSPAVRDDSMDVVVCTLVLCSVREVEAVLAEVLRVLRPGGAYYFLEHVRADPASWNYFFQRILDPTWKYIGDGCKLTKETWKYLESGKFSDVKLRHIQAPSKYSPVKPHIIGYAVK